MKKIAFMLVSLLIIVSCNFEKPVVDDNGNTGYRDFKLTEKISVNSTLSGTRVLVFDSYPYSEGDLVKSPILVATSPFTHEIKVAKAVESLYVMMNGQIIEYEMGNISLSESGLRTRAGSGDFSIDEIIDRFVALEENGEEYAAGERFFVTVPDGLYAKVVNAYPDGVHHIAEENYSLYSDITVPEDDTHIWFSFITTGGTSFAGDLWYYTYEVDENGDPIWDDAYTREVGNGDGKLIKLFTQVSDFNKRTEDIGRTVYLGKFTPNTHIGVMYQGNSDYPKYSTTLFNQARYPNLERVYNTNFSGGIFKYLEYNGTMYYTLGAENRFPGEKSFDCDFNDIVVIITANPELELEEEIPTPPLYDYVEWSGLWLFEDNYPYEGDYDFNDVVVEFTIKEVFVVEEGDEGVDPEEEFEIEPGQALVTLKVLAKGAHFANSFGINTFEPAFTGLNDFKNVFETQTEWVELESTSFVIDQADEYIPYLDNGQVEFNLNTYNAHDFDFPNAFEIPYTSAFNKFFWCIEYTRIDDAYPRYKNWVDSGCTVDVDWYMDTPVEGTVWNR